MSEGNVSMGKIEELKKRANVSYKDAKLLLEKHNGDIIEALIELEQTKKTYENYNYDSNYSSSSNANPNSSTNSNGDNRFFTKIKRLFFKGNKTKLFITNNNETVANIPVNYAIIFTIFAFHLMLFTLLLVFATGCKISIKKSQGEIIDIDEAIIDLSKGAEDTKNENMDESTQNQVSDNAVINSDKVKVEKDGYNEYTVE